MINLENCVVCGSPENLNTSMTITIDNEQIAVKICDIHDDDVTPKHVKKCYLEKQNEIAEVIEKARSLGLTVNPPGSGRTIVTAERTAVPPQNPPQSREAQEIINERLDPSIANAIKGGKEDGILPTSVVDGITQQIRSAAGGDANAESHSAHNPNTLQDKLPEGATDGRVKLEAAAGRGGQPIAIPSVRVDNTGTTTVRVQQSVNDDVLQRRFKELASSTDADGANKHSFASGGYDVHNCPLCHGDCTIKNKGNLETCPKCGGSGLLNN